VDETFMPQKRMKALEVGGSEIVDIVGPICEGTDYFARKRAMPPVDRGDLVAVFSAGAYGYTMASNYNARPLCPEVLVDGDRFTVIRKRQTYEDLIELEK
jgi:diaminopimelate decarboxylase